MYPSSPQAYDRAITVFSPDGRLYQVEYAREAVKKGSTALGMIYKDGVLLCVDKNITSRLLKGSSIEKIYKIDDHVAAAASGLVADARRLVDSARTSAQEQKLWYSEPIDIALLTRELCDLKQGYTQWGGARPFGTSLIITGIDDTGKHLFETDPSGAYNELYASVIGAGKPEVEAMFEKEYNSEMQFDDAVQLALRSLMKVGDRKISSETIEMSYISEKDKIFTKLSSDELEKHIQKAMKKK
jgi:proteasome alpha subunit